MSFPTLAACLLAAGITMRGTAQDEPAPIRPRTGRSQVVDDSTKNVYGPKTTLWASENTLFRNEKKNYTPLDTIILNYHRWTYVQRFNNYYKDLGNVGTALCPIFPTLPGTVGATSGFTAFEPYFQTEEPRYFNTKSPYTRIFIVWGGKGRAMTRVEFTRNINPRWNFGFNYRPILADKQIQYRKNTKQTISHYYDFFTTYQSKNEKYFLLFNYRRIRHRVYENGGIVFPNDGTYSYSQYFDKDAPIHLTAATNEEKRSVLHLFQQFTIAQPLQVYVTNDYIIQFNKFTDATSSESVPGTFDLFRGDSTTASDRSEMRIVLTEAGVKGTLGPLFYDFYYKLRSYRFENIYYAKNIHDLLAYRKIASEHYTGARVALKFDSLTELSGNAEYLLDGNFKAEAFWKSRWIDAYARNALSKPTMIQQAYFGSHDIWSNSFGNVASLQWNGFLKAQLGPLFISPGATFTNLNNYIFFREKIDSVQAQRVLPYQSRGRQTIFSPEVRLSLRLLKHIFLRSQVIYTSMIRNDDDAIQIPSIFFNGQLCYEGLHFKGNLEVQVGIDAHWKSAYKALGYDPVIQQFYLQDQFTSPSFLLADVFLNAKLKRGKFFVKYHNLVQAFTQVGYVPTPGYPGQYNLLDFGFELLLFD